MTYTVRFCHMKELSPLKVGDTVTRGMKLGEMGSTGQSTGAHVHIDVTEGWNAKPFKLADIACGALKPDFQQLVYFIDEELGGGPFRVTTYPYAYDYFIDGHWKAHPAYDVVVGGPIYWNRSMPGEIIASGFSSGYGNHIHVAFETE